MLDFPGPGGLTAGQVFSSGGKSWQWDGAKWGPATGGGAPLDSPVFTGDPKAPTPLTADNDTSIATTAFVKAQGYLAGNQTLTLSGDVTGSGATAIATALAAVNANIGTFQGLTLDAKGRVTAASNQGYVTGGPYLPTAGGTVSGALAVGGALSVTSNINSSANLVFNNGAGIYGKDTGGTSKFVMSLATDNQIYISDAGGRQVIIQDQVRVTSDVIIPNNRSYYGYDTGGTPRPLATVNATNQLSYGYSNYFMLIYPGVGTSYRNVRHDFQDTNGAALTVFQAAGTYNQSGAWIALSDRSLKVAESIVPYERGLAAIAELRPVSFVYAAGTPFADENETVRIGLLADEAEAVVPEIVGEASFEKTGSVQTVSAGLLVFALINSVQELLTRIETLEARLPPAAAQ